MNVLLPETLDRQNIYVLLNGVINKKGEPIENIIDFDFSCLKFIKPVGVTVLGNIIEWLKIRKTACRMVIPTRHSLAIKYLDDSLFFEKYLGYKLLGTARKRNTTINLENVSYERSEQWLENIFITWLSYRLSLTPLSLANIKMCIGEIFNNIKDHSMENIGCVFAQHYPRLNMINIAISDFGVGIPHNVRKCYPLFNDFESISKAMEDGFTTGSTPRNTGAGLGILLKNVVQQNMGEVYIHSNHGILINRHINGDIILSGKNIAGFYPGTLIEIILRTDTIENIINFEEEFVW